MNRECKDIILRIDSYLLSNNKIKIYFGRGQVYAKEQPVDGNMLPFPYMKHIARHYFENDYLVDEGCNHTLYSLTIRKPK